MEKSISQSVGLDLVFHDIFGLFGSDEFGKLNNLQGPPSYKILFKIIDRKSTKHLIFIILFFSLLFNTERSFNCVIFCVMFLVTFSYRNCFFNMGMPTPRLSPQSTHLNCIQLVLIWAFRERIFR